MYLSLLAWFSLASRLDNIHAPLGSDIWGQYLRATTTMARCCLKREIVIMPKFFWLRTYGYCRACGDHRLNKQMVMQYSRPLWHRQNRQSCPNRHLSHGWRVVRKDEICFSRSSYKWPCRPHDDQSMSNRLHVAGDMVNIKL